MKAWVVAHAFLQSGRDVLILTGEGQAESKLYQNLEFFASVPLLELPSWETLPSEKVAPSSDIVGSRQKTLQTIISRTKPTIVISSLQASLQRVLAPSVLEQEILHIKRGEEIPFDVFISHLQAVGYERRTVAVEKGDFAVRGGIIDLFPVTENRPFRIEFCGDGVEAISHYDPLSQRTHDRVDRIEVTPAKELESLERASDENIVSIFDLLGKKSLVVLDDLERLEDRYASLVSQGGVKSKIFMGVEEWLDKVLASQLICLSSVSLETMTEVRKVARDGTKPYALKGSVEPISFSMFQREFSLGRLNHPFSILPDYYEEACLLQAPPQGEELLSCLLQTQDKTQTTLVVQSIVELEWIKKKLDERGGTLLPQTTVKEGFLSAGFARRDTNELFFATAEVTGRMTVRRDTRRMTSLVTEYDAFELEPGDFVVHFHHGFGRYCGIERRPDSQGREQEFFVIEYAERAKLYVPLTQAHLITKYVGGKEEAPKLHILGSNRWKRMREDTERAILGYASELLQLQANRVIKGGFAFSPDWMPLQLFEAEFPYTETDDQLKAIADIKQDMCSSKAMDRLVCGDVGYGKTEVAMRAAFKAVSDNKKQVAVLAPTTVLALQHFENFAERMQPFGIRIGVLSRFQTTKQNRSTVEKIEGGEVDIIVGTHRLIQKDVQFKDLGLIVIDEEQRFGVKAKEQLKMLKEGVDCLTLSATPIPRTLYSSLIGIRDLSTISTPPHDRLPVKTVIAESDDELIQAALMRELNRGGQAFYIHNRVETIFEAAERVKRLVPRARIAIGHGQMGADELDLVFHTFKRGDVDVLVATTIVENGIDIPNANTIIIDRADQFGIADLYQLRGRVGRWNRRAYAYFIVSKRMLSDIARKRIEAIAQAGGYGGGLKVAMRDLEIRGAGDILGTEQSGHVANIGFHLYCKLLKRTIDSLQGKASSWTLDTRIETPFDARLPEQYVNEVSLRMEFYQRFGEAKSLQEVDEMANELRERFGQLPPQAQWLVATTKLKVFAAQKGFTLVKLESHTLTLERKTGTPSSSNKILMALPKTPEELEKKVFAALE
ncbi:MAG: transcription-repair coupling factor [Candidatus Marsarchaeota archaeon]|nr:transcription-repair coupling factor [Candidatus Marsarchaeota archaeon]